jgi:hypothetical protein
MTKHVMGVPFAVAFEGREVAHGPADLRADAHVVRVLLQPHNLQGAGVMRCKAQKMDEASSGGDDQIEKGVVSGLLTMFSQAPAVPKRSWLASWWAATCPMARFTQHASSGTLFAYGFGGDRRGKDERR